MKTRDEIELLVKNIYKASGNDPDDLSQIKPVDGSWHDALSYDVTRSDGKQTRIFRRDIDDKQESSIAAALSSFSWLHREKPN